VGRTAGQDDAHSRERADYLALCIRDVLHDGSFDDDGSWEDDSALYHPRQFDLAGIQAPVSLWHGLKEQQARGISRAHARNSQASHINARPYCA
jgi:hypothetical protein